jgi:hypothetical protein
VSVVSTRDAILIVVVVWNNSKEIGGKFFTPVSDRTIIISVCSIKAAKVFLQGHGYEVVVPNPTVTGELLLALFVAAHGANDMVN